MCRINPAALRDAQDWLEFHARFWTERFDALGALVETGTDEEGETAMTDLTLRRVIDAPVQRVYASWTDPELLTQWLAPGDAVASRAVADVAVGGTFLIEMRGTDGQRWLARGVYREVAPLRRLVHTWRSEGSDTDTLVTIEFEPESADRTRLTLTHARFTQDEARDEHERSWADCLEKLRELCAACNRIASTARPDWVSDDLFPFESRFLALPPDHRMHYIDEGKGEPLVFVHGNPAWSCEFRHPVRELRSEFRCVALDRIGFRLSSRSALREDHRPESHAHRLTTLLDHLDLREITLFMTAWGGPIGLDFARKHPERVKRLVIANTWCWPVRDDFHFKSFSFLMSSWIGQYLLRHHNIFVNGVMPRAVGDRSVLTPEIMAHYRSALSSPAARAASAALPGYIVGASDWLRSIWGLKDIAFRRKELERWKSALWTGRRRHGSW